MHIKDPGTASQMEPYEPSLFLLLLGYFLAILGIGAFIIRVSMMLRQHQTLDWWITDQFIICFILFVAGIGLLRRDNRIMRELAWSEGQDYVVYLLGKEIRRYPAPKHN